MFAGKNLATAFFGLLAVAAQSQAATVLFEDNFDANPIAVPGTPAGWTTFQGTVDRIGFNGYAAHDLLPGNGVYIDMDGTSAPGAPYAEGGIHTNATFDFVPGITYRLSYDLAGSQRHDVPDNAVDAYINNGGPDVTFSSHTLASATGFTTFVDTFTVGAPVNTAQIFFRAVTGVSDDVGLLLDNVKLTAVPLPAAVWLMLSGIAGLGAFARRRRGASVS